MTDYTRASGTGEILIRDSGSWVDFYFRAGYSSDMYNGLSFSWIANGSTTSTSINYPTGGAWYHVGWVNVAVSQTVTFKLNTATGISGMGGPTSLSAALNRSGVPAAPSKPSLSNITATTVLVKFTDGGNGGATIDTREIGYSTTSSPTNSVYSNGSTTLIGLTPGTTYNFWARTHNANGWSPWSTSISATLPKVPAAPSQPLLASVTADTVDVSWSPPDNGGSTILGYEVGYGISSMAPNTVISALSPQTVAHLSPGTTYYFWVRAWSAVGTGAWSPSNYAQTVAGAYICGPLRLPDGALIDAAGHFPAVPYVNVAGVWKPAEVWVRNLGTWSRTT